MAALSDDISKLFPLNSITDVVKLFTQQLNTTEPNLSVLSLTIGYIENTLANRILDQQQQQPLQKFDILNNFPVVHKNTIEHLYKKFLNIVANAEINNNNNSHNINKIISSSTRSTKYATREIIKKISDIIWHSLLRSSYKDRAHLQSLYSYLSGNKLDCFGVALAVVCGCQALGYKDVNLAISEDHVWVIFGKTGEETIEVTWHGKGAEDKRGQSVQSGVETRTWIYLNGYPVVCTRHLEVAAIILAINPSLSPNSACIELVDLQQQLLWALYDLEILKRYPMGLGYLGELEEAAATPNRPSCEALYKESVEASRKYYKDHHVYPYTYQGGYYYRQNMYREAFSAWADSGDVIRLYNYSRDDEEIYKEFQEIANEFIPHVMKSESSGHSARSILRDPHCFANLLRFYDGICQWEEGSLTPILHIGWAKPLVNTISKFDHDIRSQVIINCEEEPMHAYSSSLSPISNTDEKPTQQIAEKEKKALDELAAIKNNNNNIEIQKDNNNIMPMPTTLEALTVACGEKILNPDFLLQGGTKLFSDGNETTENNNIIEKFDDKKVSEEKPDLTKPLAIDVASASPSVPSAPTSIDSIQTDEMKKPVDESINNENDDFTPKRPVITLYSHKMKGLKDLLLAEKLNTNAISLQITAQSQGGKKNRTENEGNSRPKRSRRE